MSRFIKQTGDIRKGLMSQRNSSGQMEHFRHSVQELGPAMQHVEDMAHKVNGAPSAGNKNDWHYFGSIPWEVLLDYLRKRSISIDEFARNDGDCKTKFKKWFLNNREMRRFNADYYHPREMRISMPGAK